MPELQRPAANVPSRLIRLAEVCRIVGLSRSAVLSRVVAGTFPTRFSLGGRAVAWRLDHIEAWIAERTAVPAVLREPVHATRSRGAKVAERRAAEAVSS